MAVHKRTIVCSDEQHILPERKVGESGFKGGCRCQGCLDGHYEHTREYRTRQKVRSKRAEHNKKWREQHEAEWIKHYRADGSAYRCRVRRQQKEYTAWLASIKLENGCIDCGYKDHPAAMEFDHVRGEKLFQLACGQGRSKKVLLAEIAKCDVVCSNCHHIRTYERRLKVYDETA